jgi:transcriptional regulator with XRE-family HTH domain
VPEVHTYKLTDAALLRRLMQRTGTGRRMPVRALAEASGLSIGTISNLLTRQTESVPCKNAHAIADAIGVDVLILFTPTGRAVPDPDTQVGSTEKGAA